MIKLNSNYYNSDLIISAYNVGDKYYVDFINGTRTIVSSEQYTEIIGSFYQIGETYYNLFYIAKAGTEGDKYYLDFKWHQTVRIYVSKSIYDTVVATLVKVNSTYYSSSLIFSANIQEGNYYIVLNNGNRIKTTEEDWNAITGEGEGEL